MRNLYNLFDFDWNLFDDFLHNWDGDDLVNVLLNDFVDFDKLWNNCFQLYKFFLLNHLFNDLFDFNHFWNFNHSFNNLFNDLLDWNLFSDCFLLRNNNLLCGWDLNDFLLDDELLLFNDVGLGNFDNLFDNSLNFFDFVVFIDNLHNFFNYLWHLHNLFLDVWDGNWFFDDLFNFDWDFDGQGDGFFDFNENLSFYNCWNNFFNN